MCATNARGIEKLWKGGTGEEDPMPAERIFKVTSGNLGWALTFLY